MTNHINTKAALSNLTAQAGACKTSALMLTASIIVTLAAYGNERTEEAQAAIRSTLIASGFVKLDKGTKQPSNKARNYIACATAAYKTHEQKIRTILNTAEEVHTRTASLAAWVAGFALSNNHYEGGVYLMPLTLSLSKAACKDRIKSKEADNQEVHESEVTKVPAKGKAKAAVKGSPSAKEELETIASASGIIAAIKGMVKVSKGGKPSIQASNAVVKLFHDLDTVSRLLRGEKVKASKELGLLAASVAIHFENVKKAAKKAAKAKDVASINKAA